MSRRLREKRNRRHQELKERYGWDKPIGTLADLMARLGARPAHGGSLRDGNEHGAQFSAHPDGGA